MIGFNQGIFSALYFSGIVHLKRRYKPRRPLTILGYHQIDTPDFLRETMGWSMNPEKFQAQMEYIARYHKVITPKELEGAVKNKWPLPKNAVALTFDDGYRDVHDVALPILKKLGLQAIVFLTTGALDSQRSIWTNTVYYYFYLTRKSLFHMILPDGSSLGGRWASPQEKRQCIIQVNKRLKSIPDHDRPKAMSVLATSLEIGHGEDPILELPMLTWNSVRELKDSGVFSLGAHTVNHPILSRCDPSVQKHELETAKHRIEQETGVGCRYLAYPNGQLEDFTEETRVMAQEAGYSLAFQFCPSRWGESAAPMAVPRHPVMVSDLAEFAWVIA